MRKTLQTNHYTVESFVDTAIYGCLQTASYRFNKRALCVTKSYLSS